MSETTEQRHDDAPPAASKHTSAAADATGGTIEQRGDTTIGRAVTINKPADELYRYWRDFANLQHFMENVVRIEVRDDTHSHWVVKGPVHTVEWDATVTQDVPGKLIAWASDEGADVPNSGTVEFRDAGARGTVVVATINYDPPGGVVGKVIAKMFQREPAIQARRDLRRFKQLMETGEIAVSARSPADAEEELN